MSEVAVVGDGKTAGGMLREARQASGMHIAALAVALKVPVSKLEALEADNYAALPDTVFVRALASSVCRTLKVDAAPILALLPQSNAPRLVSNSAGLNAPVKGRAGKSSLPHTSPSSFGGSTSRSVAVVVLVLLAGALALVYFPRPSESAGGEGSPANADQLASVATEGVTPAVQAPVERAVAELPPAQAPAVETMPPVRDEVASAPAFSASSPSNTAVPTGILLLRARSESWVQVRDAAGAMVLQRNLVAAESVSVSGALPLSVVVGRADVTEVFVRGKPFELGAVSRENVARFEVK
jgi:cytoskeleton protein RodZ